MNAPLRIDKASDGPAAPDLLPESARRRSRTHPFGRRDRPRLEALRLLPSRRTRAALLMNPRDGQQNREEAFEGGGRFSLPTAERERENRPQRFRQSRASRLVAARDAVSPLPEGEGQGEGERDAANQNGRTDFTSSTRPAPRANSLCCQKQISRRVLSRTGVSRQARWCFERCFPLTPALSLGERENRPPRFRQSRASRFVAARDAVSPPPCSRGAGIGLRSVVYPVGSLLRPPLARMARQRTR